MIGDDNHNGDHPETSNPSPLVPSPTQQILHIVSSIKLPILKKGKCDIWAIKIEHYLSHTDYPIWKVIHNGNGPISITTDTNEMIKVLPSKTAKEVWARERERKARTTLLMALPKDHLAKFHKRADAKEIWEAIKSRFGGNDESKKMQKYLLKQQFEGFSVSTSEGLHKGCDSAPQLDYDDLEHINNDDMEEMDLKWQVAMIFMRIKKFHKRKGRKDCRAKGNQDSRRRDAGYNGNKARDNGRRPAYQDDSKSLVTIDGEDIEWSGHVEEDAQNYVMMAYSSSNSGSNKEVKSCSKTCEESYARLKKLYDEQRDKLGDASVEIIAYTLALKKVEAQLLCHQQNQLTYEQNIRFMKIDLDDKTDVLAYHKKLLAEAVKEKEDLKTKFKNWQNPSKNLNRLLNTQMSANDKIRLGYGDYKYGNYMPFGPDVEIDYSKFTYGPKQTSVDESNSKTSEYASCKSDSSVETPTFMFEPVKNAPKVVCEPKVWTDALIIEEYESDSDNDLMSNVQEDIEKPSFAFTDSVKHVVIGETKEILGTKSSTTTVDQSLEKHDPHRALKDKGIVDSGCFRYITGNKAHLANYQEFKGGSVAFGGSNERIIGKGKIKASKLDFEDVYYMEELKHYNIFLCYKCVTKRTRFSWVYFLKSKDETTPILKDFIRQAKTQFNHKAKTIRSDNGIEFKNGELIEFSRLKGIKREYSNARTPQQNRVAERKNRTLIEAARTMLGDSFLPTTFWAEVVNTACYVLNRVLVTKPQNKTPYEFLTGPKEANNSVGTQANDDQGANLKEIDLHEEHFVLAIWSAYSTTVKSSGDKIQKTTDFKTCDKPVSQVEQIFKEELKKLKRQENEADDAARKDTTHENQNANTNNTNILNVVSTPISTAGPSRALNNGEPSYPDDPSIPHLEDIYASPSERIFTDSSYDDEGAVTDFNNLETTVNKSWCDEFEELMKNRFQTSSMGELTFFIKIQVKQKEDGIFISQDKYVTEILKKFDFLSVKTASTPIETQKPLVKNKEVADVDKIHNRRLLISWQETYLMNQLLDYGFNIMNTKIYIDNESTICIVKNPVFHSKTKHIEIQHHFIKDAYEKKLIQVLKIHTDDNVADLLTKDFDVSSKELASPKQTTLGKDNSNPLIVDSLLKTIWLSMHHVIAMKHWLF
nr:ribonuclease H-like domain-containing protein [Tanacetum cinerariifolium]